MLWAVLAVVIAFAGGFLWQFYEASTVRGELDATEQELVLERLRVRLGQAALAANTGSYEPARQQMSDFFGQLQDLSPALPTEVRRVADDFLTMRDDVITGLSRGNPEYAAVLYGMHETLSTAIDRSQATPAEEAAPTGNGPPDGSEAPAETTPEVDDPGR